METAKEASHILPYARRADFHVGRASELTGKDRRYYRMLEILPATLAYGSLLATIALSYFAPVIAAYFIIAFDLYWLIKTIYLVIHHIHNWRRLKHNMALDWEAMLANLQSDHVHHLIILPFYKEGEEVLRASIDSYVKAKFDSSKLFLVLGAEERAGEEQYALGLRLAREYADNFADIIVTKHPADLPGEAAGKGSNISWAAEEARTRILDARSIAYENVVVSAFDVDSVVYEHYFSCLTWHFLTTEDPHHTSYQPVPFYNNNIWQAPSFSRVVASSGTFWQMIQQERPEKLVTFSSHGVSFKALYEVNYWQRNMVSEDSRIFWNLLMANNGAYKTVPMSYPISMDANLARTNLGTAVNIYKQQRRWSWGVENLPYVLYHFTRNKMIPIGKRIRVALTQMEGYWSLATNPLFILLLGWLPLVLGGKDFNSSILSYNLPIVTRNLMTIAMIGLFISAIVSISLLPRVPDELRKKKTFWLVRFFQWVLVPITIVIFGAIPGLDAQLRLALGKYMGFWVTPKDNNTSPNATT
jgi:hypothetical protein